LENEVEVAVEENVSVPVDLLEQKPHYVDQIDFRLQQVLEFLDKHGVTSDQILCIASRGGPIKPLPAGTYQITKEIEQDIMQERILSPHSSLIGPVVAFRLASNKYNTALSSAFNPACSWASVIIFHIYRTINRINTTSYNTQQEFHAGTYC